MNVQNNKIIGYDQSTGQPIYENIGVQVPQQQVNQQFVNNNQNINNYNQQQNNMYNKPKKNKYWLIPVLVFVTMIVSKTLQLTLLMFEINIEFINDFFNIIFILCGLAVWPCIILAVILSIKKNN